MTRAPRHILFARVPRRRGSVYAMVLGVAMLITVIGIGAVATSRVTQRGTTISADWQDAGAAAFSAVEHAIAKINAEAASSPATWRNAYTSGATAFTAPFGRGTMKWVLIDTDGSIADDVSDPIRLYGIGQVGATKRVYSVQLSVAGDALDVLRTGVHSHGNMSVVGSVMAIGGPVSTNGSLSITGTLRGSSEITPIKPMPSATVYDLYRARATELTPNNLASGTININGVSAADNPYGAENREGIYYLKLPADVNTFTILESRFKGTLLIEPATGRGDQMLILDGPMLLEPDPDRGSLPTLIVKGLKEVTIKGSLSLCSDGSRSEIRGLVHFSGVPTVKLKNEFYLNGCAIVDGSVQLSDTCAFVADPTLLTRPPMGYTNSNKMALAPGTWKWDAPPPGH